MLVKTCASQLPMTLARGTSRRMRGSSIRLASTSSSFSGTGASHNGNMTLWAATAAAGVAAVACLATQPTVSTQNFFGGNNNKDPSITTSGDIITAGTPVKEPATGILFPPLCNGYTLVGTGVRVKYGLVKVYAVGTYVDALAISAIKTASTHPEAMEAALLDPNYPRTIRIVMNRALSIEKYTAAIVEAIEPRMLGRDLDKLEEFKRLNPPVDLVQGAEMEMTIRGDTLLYKNAVGGVGTIRSRAFTTALCDVYYGKDPVSPTHKAAVMEGIPKL